MVTKKVKPAKKPVKKTPGRASEDVIKIKSRFGDLGPILRKAADLAETLKRHIDKDEDDQLTHAADALDRELLILHKLMEGWNQGAADKGVAPPPPPPGTAQPLYAPKTGGRMYVGC